MAIKAMLPVTNLRLSSVKSNDKLSFDKIQVDTLQKQLDSLIPGLMGLLLTFACMWLLKKKVSPITIIIGLFVVGIVASFFGIM